MERIKYLMLYFVIFFAIVACAPSKPLKSQPSINKINNDFIDASIAPIYRLNGYKGFIMDIHNKTSGNIKIDWNETYYIHDGKKKGGFWFEGVRRDAEKKIIPTVIPSGEMFTKELYPADLRVLSAMAAAHVNENMMPGENGIQLTIDINGKIESETTTFIISNQ